MTKTLIPIRICLFIAGTVTLIELVLVYGLSLAGKLQLTGTEILIGAILFFSASYGISYFFIKNYLQKKLGQIYKAIRRYHRTPNTPLPHIPMTQDVLDQVQKDVTQWAQELDQQVKTQTQLADYRRAFIGNFSHEIQTPIFNIQGYIETLLDGAINDDQVRLKYLNQASKNVTRLISIVEDLTTISKLEYNQVVMEFEYFDIIDLVKDVLDELALKAKESNITLKLNSHGHSFLTVKGDPMAIRQVLSNLISNAIKYGKKKGQATINLLNMDTYVIVQIIDNGIGIEQKHIQHLCDRFYRVNKSRSRLKGGTGLGLSIVKHILEAHNQSLSISSVYGKGSTFAFHLEK